MKRRQAILAAAAAAFAPPWALAQEKLRRVGWLTGGSPKSHAKLLEAFRAGMKEHGWVEGKNLALELRWAEGKLDRLDTLAAEMVALKPDVIVTAANVVHAAVKRATSTIPIVMLTGADPIATGLVTNLARPGGNITGLSGFFEATPIKMMELAAALTPRGGLVAVLGDPNTLFGEATYRRQVDEAASRAGVRRAFVDVKTMPEVYQALEAMKRDLRIPVIYPFEESAEAGGLMSYAAPLADGYRRAARYVDLILRGAKPGDLPIEQPTRLSLTVNLKTAKAQGIEIPREVVLRADRVIE